MPSSLRKPDGRRERRTTNTPALSNRRTVCRPDHERDKLCVTRDQGLTQMSCGWLSMIGYVAELQERHATQHFVRPSEIWERIRISVFFSIPSQLSGETA